MDEDPMKMWFLGHIKDEVNWAHEKKIIDPNRYKTIIKLLDEEIDDERGENK